MKLRFIFLKNGPKHHAEQINMYKSYFFEITIMTLHLNVRITVCGLASADIEIINGTA